MYRMNEVKDLPPKMRRSCPHVTQLREFLSSGKKQVVLAGVPESEVRRVYNGLMQATRRPEFKGLVTAKHYGNTIYLIRGR